MMSKYEQQEISENRINKINQDLSNLGSIYSITRSEVDALTSAFTYLKNEALPQNSLKLFKDAANVLVNHTNSSPAASNPIHEMFQNYVKDSHSVIAKLKELSTHSQADMLSIPAYTEYLDKVLRDALAQQAHVNTTFNNVNNINKATRAMEKYSPNNSGNTPTIMSMCSLQLYAELSLFFRTGKNIPAEIVSVWNDMTKYEVVMQLSNLPDDLKSKYLVPVPGVEGLYDLADLDESFIAQNFTNAAHTQTLRDHPSVNLIDAELGQILNSFYLRINLNRKKLENNHSKTVAYTYYYPIVEPVRKTTTASFKPLFKNLAPAAGEGNGQLESTMEYVDDLNSGIRIVTDKLNKGFGVMQKMQPKRYGLGGRDNIISKRISSDIYSISSHNQELLNRITNVLINTKNKLAQLETLTTKNMMSSLTDKFLIFYNIIINRQLFTAEDSVWMVTENMARDAADLCEGVISKTKSVNTLQSLAKSLKEYFENLILQFNEEKKKTVSGEEMYKVCRTSDNYAILNFSQVNSLVQQVITTNAMAVDMNIAKYNTYSPDPSASVTESDYFSHDDNLVEFKYKPFISEYLKNISYSLLTNIDKEKSEMADFNSKLTNIKKSKNLVKFFDNFEITSVDMTVPPITDMKDYGQFLFRLMNSAIKNNDFEAFRFNLTPYIFFSDYLSEDIGNYLAQSPTIAISSNKLLTEIRNDLYALMIPKYAAISSSIKSNGMDFVSALIKHLFSDNHEVYTSWATKYYNGAYVQVSASPTFELDKLMDQLDTIKNHFYNFILYFWLNINSAPFYYGFFNGSKFSAYTLFQTMQLITTLCFSDKDSTNKLIDFDTAVSKKVYSVLDLGYLLSLKYNLAKKIPEYKDRLPAYTSIDKIRTVDQCLAYLTEIEKLYDAEKTKLTDNISSVNSLPINITSQVIPSEEVILRFFNKTLMSKNLAYPKSLQMQIMGPSGVGKSFFLYGKETENNGLVHALPSNEGKVRIYDVYGLSFMYKNSMENACKNPLLVGYNFSTKDPSSIATVVLKDKGTVSDISLESFKNHTTTYISGVAKNRRDREFIRSTYNNKDSSRSVFLVSIESQVGNRSYFKNFVDKPGSETLEKGLNDKVSATSIEKIYAMNHLLGATLMFIDKVAEGSRLQNISRYSLHLNFYRSFLPVDSSGNIRGRPKMVESFSDADKPPQTAADSIFMYYLTNSMPPANSTFVDVPFRAPSSYSIYSSFYDNETNAAKFLKYKKIRSTFEAVYSHVIGKIKGYSGKNEVLTSIKNSFSEPLPAEFLNMAIEISEKHVGLKQQNSFTVKNFINADGLDAFVKQIGIEEFKSGVRSLEDFMTCFATGEIVYQTNGTKDQTSKLQEDNKFNYGYNNVQNYVSLHPNICALFFSLYIHYKCIEEKSSLSYPEKIQNYLEVNKYIFDLPDSFVKNCISMYETFFINEMNNNNVFKSSSTKKKPLDINATFYYHQKLGDVFVEAMKTIQDTAIIDSSVIAKDYSYRFFYNHTPRQIGSLSPPYIDDQSVIDMKKDSIAEKMFEVKYSSLYALLTPAEYLSASGCSTSEFLKKKSVFINDSTSANVLIMNAHKAANKNGGGLDYAGIFYNA